MPGASEAPFTANGSADHVKDGNKRGKKAVPEVISAFITNLFDILVGKKLPYSIQLTGFDFFSHGLKFLSSSFDMLSNHKASFSMLTWTMLLRHPCTSTKGGLFVNMLSQCHSGLPSILQDGKMDGLRSG
jgi:hypothetical protein